MDKQDVTEKAVAVSGNATPTTTPNVNTSLSAINLFNPVELEQAEILIRKLIASDKSGIKSVPEALAILVRTKDLGIPFSAGIDHIHVINGKTGADIHVIRSLLSRAGVTWECTKDYTPQYQYTDGNTIYNDTQLPSYCVRCKTAKEAQDKTVDDNIGVYPVRFYMDLKGNVLNEFEINDKMTIALNKVQAVAFAKEGKYPILRIPAQPIDFTTEYTFTRYKLINGKERVMTSKGYFSRSEAIQAGLIEKDNWAKYTRIMVGVRAFTLGARDIADDVIMGVMETTELKMVENVPLEDSDFVNAEIIN